MTLESAGAADPSAGSADNGRRGGLSTAARRLFPILQWLCVPLALWLGLRGYRLIDGPAEQEGIDRAAAYFGVALLLMAFFAWDGHFPAVATWPKRVAGYVRAHPVELALLAGVTAAGAFMRLWQYGTLPPDGYLVLEEHINGGIAWDVLNGGRPYAYPIPRYVTALSIKVFGPSTDGLRNHLMIASIASIPFFYLMLREATDRTSAMFATAVFASLRVLGDTMAHHQTPMLAEILMVWMALRGVRSGVLLWFVPSAALGVILCYEYETVKAVPLFFAAFLGWIVIRRLVWPLPRGIGDEWGRVRMHAPAVLKTAVIVGVIFLIGISPIVGQSHRGQNVYFSSLDRQRVDREGRGTPGLFAPDWEKQLRVSAQVYTPWVEPDFTELSSIEAGGAIDWITSLLIWAGTISGIIFFWRGYRALFIGWWVGGMLISALLLSTWAPWKVIGWLVPAVALTAFLVEDAQWLLRRYWQAGLRALPVVLAGIVAAIFYFNLQVLDANANNPALKREYANSPSQQFVICDELRKRDDDVYALVSQRARTSWGWSQPLSGDIRIDSINWGDFRFVCMGLEGRSESTLSELWPVNITADRPITLSQVGPPSEIARIVDELALMMPELGAPDLQKRSPADVFELLMYDTNRSELNARHGLTLQWFDAGGSMLEERMIAGPRYELGTPPSGAASYRLYGLVYLDPGEGEWALVPDGGTTADAVQAIATDGSEVYAAPAGGPVARPIVQVRGWHLAEITGAARDGATVGLAWQWSGGGITTVPASHAFALATDDLWRHERMILLPDTTLPFEALRYDLGLHYAALDGLRVGPDDKLPLGTRVLKERWQAVLTVPQDGVYRLTLSAFRQRFEMFIDGTDPFGGTQREPVDQAFIDVRLTAGDHHVEINLEPAADDVSFTGGDLSFSMAASDQAVEFGVRPY